MLLSCRSVSIVAVLYILAGILGYKCCLCLGCRWQARPLFAKKSIQGTGGDASRLTESSDIVCDSKRIQWRRRWLPSTGRHVASLGHNVAFPGARETVNVRPRCDFSGAPHRLSWEKYNLEHPNPHPVRTPSAFINSGSCMSSGGFRKRFTTSGINCGSKSKDQEPENIWADEPLPGAEFADDDWPPADGSMEADAGGAEQPGDIASLEDEHPISRGSKQDDSYPDAVSMHNESDDDDKYQYRVRKKGTNISQEVKEFEDLYTTMQSWGDSKKKKERDLYRFLKKQLKDIREESLEDQGTEEDISYEDFMEALGDDLPPPEDPNSVSCIFHEYLRDTKKFNKLKLKYNLGPRRLVKGRVLENVLHELEEEEKCGYRYPLTGTPDERYSDPNIYRSWGRSELHQTKFLKAPSRPHGKVERHKEALNELIVSRSPLKDEDKIEHELEALGLKKLRDSMDTVVNMDTGNNGRTENSEVTQTTGPPTVTTTVDWNGQVLDESFLSSERGRQLDLLLALNPYNPWDKYTSMKKSKAGITSNSVIPVTYKLSSVQIQMNLLVEEGAEQGKAVDSSVQKNNAVSSIDMVDKQTRECVGDHMKRVPEEFLRDYLHYFLMLPEDHEMLKEFQSAEYLYDVLRRFDLFDREVEAAAPYFRDLQDRLFSVVFPGWEGFPKKPEDPKFPMTMTPEKKVENYRVNALNALVALLRVQNLAHEHTADILTEQRVKYILETIGTILDLEVERIKLGLTDLSIDQVETKLCQIDDAYLGTLSAVLSLFNIVDGIENIVNATVLLTLSKIKDMRPKYLVAILVNLANVHRLPRSVFQKFLNLAAEHIQERMSDDLVRLAVDPGHTRWMEFESAAKLLHVLSRYEGSLSRTFMGTFMRLYGTSYLELKLPEVEELNEEWKNIMEATEAPRDGEWVSIRQPSNELVAESQKLEDETNLRVRRDMNVHAARARIVQYIWSLISCLSWCDMTSQYRELVEKLNMAAQFDDFEMNSVAALAVIETCTEKTEQERMLVSKALSSLSELKTTLTDDMWIQVMETYQTATLTKEDGKTPRLRVEPFFVKSMMNNFALIRLPRRRVLRKAVDILYSYVPYLTKNQIYGLFRQLCATVCDYSFMDRQSLNAERLLYPLGEMAYLLYIAAKSGVRIDEPWSNFLDLLHIFKHVLSLEDIRMTLAALKAANYQGASDICDLLLTRACDVVEVHPELDEKLLCDIMDLVLSLGVAPSKLLRWFLYLKFHEVPEQDMERLSQDLVRGKREFDVDFRGWKRPVNDIYRTDLMGMPRKSASAGKRKRPKPLVPSENLKYVMQMPTPKPGPYSGKIKRREAVVMSDCLKERLTAIVKRTIESGHTISPADSRLLQLASLLSTGPNDDSLASSLDSVGIPEDGLDREIS